MAVKFSSVRSVHPVPFANTWQGLKSELVDHRESESKTDGELWSPAKYLENTKRANANVESLSALVCDLDGQSYESIGEIAQTFEHLAYTTFSHSVSSPHFHIVFPLAVAVPASEWRDVWCDLHDFLGIVGDPSTKDPARVYFFPQHRPGSVWQVVENSGDVLDPTAHRSFSDRSVRLVSNRRVSKAAVSVLSDRWWDEPVDLSQYDGMSQAEIHRDMQREWAELRKRMSA